MKKLSRLGAVAFVLWGLLHLVGGGVILQSYLTGGAEAGYAVYSFSGGALPAVTGGILGYFAFLIAATGLIVIGVAVRLNWQNSEAGLVINTGVILLVETGLVLFLLIPGHIELGEALPGLVLFAVAATLGGIACHKDVRHAA